MILDFDNTEVLLIFISVTICFLVGYYIFTCCCCTGSSASTSPKMSMKHGSYSSGHHEDIGEQAGLLVAVAGTYDSTDEWHHSHKSPSAPPLYDVSCDVTHYLRGEQQQSGTQDVWAAVLFIVFVAAVCTVAITKGVPVLQHIYPEYITYDSSGDLTDSANVYKLLFLVALGVVGLVIVASIFASLFWITFYACLATFMTGLPLLVVVLALAFGSAFLLCFQHLTWGFTVLAVVLLMLMFSCPGTSSIRFAATNMYIATVALFSHLSLTFIPFMMIFVKAIWFVIWITAAMGLTAYQTSRTGTNVFYPITEIINYFKNECYWSSSATTCATIDNAGNWSFNIEYIVEWVVLVLCYFWVRQVISGIIQVTASGVLGYWWYTPPSGSARAYRRHPLCPSFGRACSSCLGSIAYGSVFVYIIEAFSALMRCICCCCPCIGPLLRYYNRFGYSYVGLYGMSYNQAAGKVVGLFEYRGIELLVNNNLMSWTLSLTALIIGVILGGTGFFTTALLRDYIVDYVDDDDFEKAFTAIDLNELRFILTILSFYIGATISSLYLRMLGGMADTSMVCFVESPSAFKTNHINQYHTLRGAWTTLFPSYLAAY